MNYKIGNYVKQMNTTTSRISILDILAMLTVSVMVIEPAYALTRFFNCTTSTVNRTQNLTLQDVNYCYDIKFPRSGH
jgi:hypothetical protein